MDFVEMSKCPDCRGRGIAVVSCSFGDYDEECPSCRGTGIISKVVADSIIRCEREARAHDDI